MDWQIFAALAVPVLGLVGAIATNNREPGAYRRLKHSVDSLAAVQKDSEAYAILQKLVVTQAGQLQRREAAKADRKLNGVNLTLSIIFSAIGAVGGFWLWNWSASVWDTGSAWVVVPLSVVIGLLIAAFVAAAFGTIFNPPAPPRAKKNSKNPS